MIAYLKTDNLPRPKRVAAPPAKADPGDGILTPGFDEGSMLLKNKDGDFFRVAWKKDDTDRRRALPPGDYVMTGYTLVRRDADGKDWYLGASGRAIRKLSVRAGEEKRIALEETIHLQCRTRLNDDGIQVQMVVHGEHHSGLTIYRDGKRILFGYRLTDAKGKELAKGQLEYG